MIMRFRWATFPKDMPLVASYTLFHKLPDLLAENQPFMVLDEMERLCGPVVCKSIGQDTLNVEGKSTYATRLCHLRPRIPANLLVVE